MNTKDLKIEKVVCGYWNTGTRYILRNKNGKECCSVCVEKELMYDKIKYLFAERGKKCLYVYNFYTEGRYRNKGYGKYLLKNILKRFKCKYDIIHVNASPYYWTKGDVKTGQSPKNGLTLEQLVDFYKSFGFEEYPKQIDNKLVIMTLQGRKKSRD